MTTFAQALKIWQEGRKKGYIEVSGAKQIIEIKDPFEQFVEGCIEKYCGKENGDLIMDRYDELIEKTKNSYFGPFKDFFASVKKGNENLHLQKYLQDLKYDEIMDSLFDAETEEKFLIIAKLYKEIGDFFLYQYFFSRVYRNELEKKEEKQTMDFAEIYTSMDKNKRFQDITLRLRRKWPKRICVQSGGDKILKSIEYPEEIAQLIDGYKKIFLKKNGLLNGLLWKKEEEKPDFDTLVIAEHNLYTIRELIESKNRNNWSEIKNDIIFLRNEICKQLINNYNVNPIEERKKIENRPIEKLKWIEKSGLKKYCFEEIF